MYLKPSATALFAALLFIFLLPGCAPEKPGLYNNDQIKSARRDDFHALNDQLFAALKANDAKRLGSIMSKDFIEDNSKFRTVELCYNRIKEDSSYGILDEYYMVNDLKGNHSIKADNKGINKYEYSYSADVPEMYVAFFVPHKEANRFMITAVYEKLDYGWKLVSLEVNQYTINGKTAPELYKLAKEEYDKKYMVDALNTTEQAYECLKPANGWAYPQEKEVAGFYSQLMDKVNRKYNFPYTLKQVKTQPQIFRVLNQKEDDGVFPMIYYLSDIKLADTAALKKENLNVKKAIGNAIPGIDKDNKYIFYSIFNQMPDGTRAFDHYDITEKVQP